MTSNKDFCFESVFRAAQTYKAAHEAFEKKQRELQENCLPVLDVASARTAALLAEERLFYLIEEAAKHFEV